MLQSFLCSHRGTAQEQSSNVASRNACSATIHGSFGSTSAHERVHRALTQTTLTTPDARSWMTSSCARQMTCFPLRRDQVFSSSAVVALSPTCPCDRPTSCVPLERQQRRPHKELPTTGIIHLISYRSREAIESKNRFSAPKKRKRKNKKAKSPSNGPLPNPLVHRNPKIEFSQKEIVFYTIGTSGRFFAGFGACSDDWKKKKRKKKKAKEKKKKMEKQKKRKNCKKQKIDKKK